ncbi:MAG: cell division protein FtsA [Nitritalea sp.]
MENEKLIVGLDIGTTKICAVVGRKNEYGKLEVLGVGKAVSDGVKRGMVANIDKTVTAIEKAVRDASDMAQADIGEVLVGIAGQHIRSSVHHGSLVRSQGQEEISVEDIRKMSNDMHNIVVPAGNRIIHVMPQDYTVDYEDGIKDPVGMSGNRLEADFHIITAQIGAIQNINRCVSRANLVASELILEPIASSLAVLSDIDKEAGVCLVDIGGGTTDIAVFYDNIIRHTAVIPLGGEIVTSDIRMGCNVLAHQAELLKTRFGKAIAEEASENEIVSIPGIRNRPAKEISMKNLAAIIQARMEEIIEFVYSELIQSGYEKQLAGGIVLTGGGALMPHLTQLFEYCTGIDTRIGYPNEHLGKCPDEELKSPMYATSIGLVLAGFMSIDNREERYRTEYAQGVVQNSGLRHSAPEEAPKESKTRGFGFLQTISETLKRTMKDSGDDTY